MKTAKKILLILLATCVAAILIQGIAWAITPGMTFLSPPASLTQVYPSSSSYTNGYQIEGDQYTPENNDPQIGMLLEEMTCQTVVISFQEPIVQDTAIQIYYAVGADALGEDRVATVTCQAGSTNAVIQLPLNAYNHIRADINGPFVLDSISLSADEAPIGYVKHPFEVQNCLLIWFGLFVFVTTIYWLQKWSVYEKLGKACDYICGKRKRLLYISICAVFVVLLLLQVNNSSMKCYSSILPNNILAEGTITLGTPRSIRSDEFLVGTSDFFHNNLNGISLLWQGTDSIFEFCYNLVMSLNPFMWGKLYIPAGLGYSFQFLLFSAVALYSFYRLFYIMTRERLFAVIASFLIVYSPGYQWWSALKEYGAFPAVVVLFLAYFQMDRPWKKILCAIGLLDCISLLLDTLYPAWYIPLAYLFAVIAIVLCCNKKFAESAKHLTRSDIIIISGTVLLLILVSLGMLIKMDATTSLETVYPGKRFSAGGDVNPQYFLHYLTMPWLPYRALTVPGMNQSEISSFLHLFPIPYVIYALQYRKLKAHIVLKGITVFNVLCLIYMLCGIGDTLATVTLLSYTTAGRLTMVWGMGTFLMLLLECFYLGCNAQPSSGREKPDKKNIIILNIILILYFIRAFDTNTEIVQYIGYSGFVLFVCLILFVANCLLFSRGKVVIFFLTILTVVSGVVVNPINFGVGTIQNTEVAREIRKIDENDEGRWLALNNIILPKYVYMQGVDCILHLSWPPQMELFEAVDETGAYMNVYNRYAHVAVKLVDEATTFELNQADAITIYLNTDDLEKWDVDYLIFQGEAPEETENVKFEQLYLDPLDGVQIYKVEYAE